MRIRLVALLLSLSLAPAAAAIDKTFAGKVLPFRIIAAVINHGFNEGKLPAQVAISVQGGAQGEWLATAAYVAEHSIAGDATYAQVSIFVPSPWGDLPPQGKKRLAEAFYAGPNPERSPWADKPWLVTAQGHAATLPDIELTCWRTSFSVRSRRATIRTRRPTPQM